ncbi:MAG: S-methyl-5-thioribose-1-phosphate isomerase, partial [Clostridia bacterium]|nr:S-methyl-5-thioribose-1-phosphate isomerase [Clostridia bacterium]
MPAILEPNLLIDEMSVLRILDQTLLPNEEVYLDLKTTEEIHEAIKKLRVRGAPAIGIAAGFGAYLAAKNIEADDFTTFHKLWKEKLDYLATSRPTAVNLFYALDR